MVPPQSSGDVISGRQIVFLVGAFSALFSGFGGSVFIGESGEVFFG